LIFLLGVLLTLTWLTYGTLLGREAGITLVVMLATLKSLELKARRDALVCMYLGFFLIFTQFLFSQGIGTAALMLLTVWGLLMSLMLGQRPLGYPRLRELGRESLRAMLWGIPLMVTLFVLFPRIGPLWALPNATRHSTGLSDSLELGDVASLAEDTSIALRIRFLDARPPASALYFRGPTLDNFDGRKWTADKLPQSAPSPSTFGGRNHSYLLTIEPQTLPVLPLLEGSHQATVVHPASGVTLTRHGIQWWRDKPSEQRLQIQAVAAERFSHGPAMQDASLRRWLFVPPGSNPRTRQWVSAWVRESPAARSGQQWSDALLTFIRQENYRYTLSPGRPPVTPHTIDHFWLDSRAGFCEHFASSYVVVMRLLGVPARIVTGYQGAELNQVDGQYVVRNSNAHAWAEIWLPQQGWVRVDPTAAVAPQRIDHSPRRPPFAGLPGPLGDMDPETLQRMRATWEAIDHRWNEWVLQYSNDDQMQLLRDLGWDTPNWETLGRILALAMAALALGSALMLKLRPTHAKRSAWFRPLQKLDRALRQVVPDMPGAVPAPASAWHDFLHSAWAKSSQALDNNQQSLLQTLLDLDASRYGPHALDDQTRLPTNVRLLFKQAEQLARACRPAPHGAHRHHRS
jgi:transglutaminase-like putative cysteine protease